MKTAQEFYTEHRQATSEDKIQGDVINRLLSDREDLLARSRNTRGQASLDASRKADTIGTNVKYNIDQQEKARQQIEQNLGEVATAIVDDPNRFPQEALQDAAQAGVHVNFSGDVATNVRPAKEQ